MALTINNTNTLSLLNILNRTTNAQSTSLQRLSTGFKINKGADDPAGLIAVQSLNSELKAVDSAISNGQRANSVLDVADGALTEVSSLLGDIESLAAASTSSGGLSASEVAANQSQIDSAVDALDRIIRTTQFNGSRLLDGTQSIRATASNTAKVQNVKVFSRPSNTSNQTFAVDVTAAGTVASATLGSFTAADSTDVSAATFSIAGSTGTATITVSGTDTLANVRDKIIATASDTGVSASVSGNTIHIQSRSFGTDKFISAQFISGDQDFLTVAHTTGTDASVTVNGQAAFVDGLNVSFSSNGTSGEFDLTTAGNVVAAAGNLTITGGGQTFQLGTSTSTQATIGVAGLFSHQLGNSTLGFLNTLKGGGANDLSTDANNAVAIAREAISNVATQQGRIGGFQKFQVQTSINSLGATKEALKGAVGVINDVDFAAETSNLSRQNVLLQSAISLLGVASQQSSQVLSLLR